MTLVQHPTTASQAATAYFDAWNRHDVKGILAVFASEGTFWDVNMAEPTRAADLESSFRDLLQKFPDLQFVVSLMGGAGDGCAIAEWRMQGTTTGEDGKPRRIDVPGVDVFDVSEEKIRAARAYFNPQTITQQLS